MNCKVAITGASGLLGHFLATALPKFDLEVFPTGRSVEQVGSVVSNYLRCDLADAHAVASLFAGRSLHGVVHAAGRIKGGFGFADFVRDNVLATANLLDCAATSAVRTFVFMSTISVYLGDGPYVEEKSAIKPLDAYGWTKAIAEELCRLYERDGMRIFVLRLGGLHGFPRRSGSIYEFFAKARRGQSLFVAEPQTRVTLTFLDDVLNAVAHVLTNSSTPPGIYNVGTVEAPTYLELAREIVARVGSNSDIEVASSPTRRNRVLQTDRLRYVLGYRPVSLNEHLSRFQGASIEAP